MLAHLLVVVALLGAPPSAEGTSAPSNEDLPPATSSVESASDAEADAPYVWRFPDSHAPALEKAFIDAGAPSVKGHLVGREAVDAWLAQPRRLDDLGCLDDRSTCPDAALGALAVLGAAGWAEATAASLPDGYQIQVRFLGLDGKPARKPLQARAEKMEDAARAIVRTLEGTGVIRVDLSPDDAHLLAGETPLGTGDGEYGLRPGRYRLRAVRDGYRPMEETIHVEAGQVLLVKFSLMEDKAYLTLNWIPSVGQVVLDDRVLGEAPGDYEIPPGMHTLRFEADGFQPYEHSLVIEAGERRSIEVELAEAESEWITRLRTPHEDNLAHSFYVSVGFDVGVVGTGDAFDVEGASLTVRDPVTNLGFDFGAGYQGRYLLVEAFRLTLTGFSDTPAVDTDGDRRAGTVESMSRTRVRAAWVGGRFNAWRFAPYGMGGLAIAWDALDVKDDASGDTLSGRSRAFDLGLEAGLRYHILPNWFAAAGGDFQLGLGGRGAAMFFVRGGWTFDWPEGL
jgi:hypothetical protein